MNPLLTQLAILLRKLSAILTTPLPATQPIQSVPATPVPTPVPTVLPTPVSVPPQPLRWDTPPRAWHATRVRCDEAGLSFAQKNILCACIFQESRFRVNPKPNENRDPHTNAVWSTDYGLVQVNDYYNIGPRKRFASIAEVLAHPEKGVDWMIETMKTTGGLMPWSSYKSGVYKQWIPLSSEMWTLASTS